MLLQTLVLGLKVIQRKRIEKYIKLEEYKQNGINILDLYLNSYNKTKDDNYVYNKKDISLSMHENNISNIPIMSSTNGIANTIGRIAYGY